MSECANCGSLIYTNIASPVCRKCASERSQKLRRQNAWFVIHTRYAEAIASGEWVETTERDWLENEFSNLVPCIACGGKWLSLSKKIDLTTAETAFRSTWEAHRVVNCEHIQPPKLTLNETQCRAMYLAEKTPGYCVVTLATGPAVAILDLARPTLQAYAKRCGADYFELLGVTANWWGLEKFRVHNLAKAYDRTLFLDCDLLIRNDCPNLFELVPPDAVAMHDDYPYLPKYDWLAEERKTVFASQGIYGDYPKQALNTGVVLCSRDQSDIWKPPKEPFPTTHCAEQIWIEYQARNFPLYKLPTELNTQWWMRDFETRKPTAHLVHWANCPHKLADMKAFFARQ